MLSFDIRSLKSQAAQVDTHLAPDDPIWEERDLKPSEPIHVEGRLSSAGQGRFYFNGSISGRVKQECRFCLTEVEAGVEGELNVIFAETGMGDEDDPDVYLFDPNANELDIRPAVREAWLLDVPAYLQCKDDCKGLCATCGKDLNTDSCDCAPVTTDSRWDALRNLKT